jgi:hypothetical protein
MIGPGVRPSLMRSASGTTPRPSATGLRAEREAKAEAERKTHEDARQAERQASRDELEARLKREFLTRPGTLESDWTEERKHKELDAHFDRQRDAAQAQAGIYRSGF